MLKTPVIIIGTGNLAYLALEILQRNDILVYGILAEQEASQLTEIQHIPILGNLDETTAYIEKIGKDSAVFVALQQANVRQRYIKQLDKTHAELSFINLIHPCADVASSALLGIGNLLDSGAQISPCAQIGNHCLVYKQAIIDIGVKIHNFVQVGAGSIIGEQVTIEENAFIGAGATIVAGLHIGKGARIGAGAVVLESVKEQEVVLGNPAKPVKID